MNFDKGVADRLIGACRDAARTSNHSLIASDSEGNKKALENMRRIVTR